MCVVSVCVPSFQVGGTVRDYGSGWVRWVVLGRVTRDEERSLEANPPMWIRGGFEHIPHGKGAPGVAACD
jgi:hypothetical protein